MFSVLAERMVEYIEVVDKEGFKTYKQIKIHTVRDSTFIQYYQEISGALSGKYGESQRVDQSIRAKLLSSNRKRLVEMMQELNFGRIDLLHIKRGEPCFMPPPLVFKDIDLSSHKDNESNTCCLDTDFVLKKQIVVLFDYLEKEGDCIVHSLIVQNGLPVRMKIEKKFRA